MKVTILCEDKFIQEARENGKNLFKEKSTLNIPVSNTGIEPATHWMCTMEVTEEGFEKLSNLVKYSKISKCSAKSMLEEMNLKIIK
jgi:hypothetical protein